MTFIPNPSFEAEMAAKTKPVLVEAATKAQKQAESLAHHAMPRRGQPRIKVDFDGGDVVLANTNWGAVIEEFGGAKVKSPTYAPLRRGVRAAGFKLHES